VSSIHSPHTSENAVGEGEEDFEFVTVKNESQDDSFYEQGFSLPERQISRR
jgi:hypothetical protein